MDVMRKLKKLLLWSRQDVTGHRDGRIGSRKEEKKTGLNDVWR